VAIRPSYSRFVVLFLVLILAPALGAQQTAHLQPARSSTTPAKPPVKIPVGSQLLFGTLPLSTKSLAARANLEMALNHYENANFDQAVLHAKLATDKDPSFALGYALWSFVARRAQPNPDALKKAKSLSSKCFGDECLMVTFLVGSQEANVLPAITAMNDLLARRPKDKHVLYLTGEWLFFQQDYEGAKKLWLKSLASDPDFPPALNMLGYASLEGGQPEPKQAIEYLKHYAAVLPTEANPQDSLGEVLRMTGDDSGSLAHYAEALQIDPHMITSQYGRGDTYAMMGDFFHSKSEYEKALKLSTNSRDTLHIEYELAVLNFWTGDASGGRKALADLSDKIAKDGDAASFFEVNFARALTAQDFATQRQLLQSLESSLAEVRPGMQDADRNAALAAVLREEVRVAVFAHQQQDAATPILKLQQLADDSRDLLVENISESAKGFISLANGDYSKASEQLSADLHAPLVVCAYVQAQEKLGDSKTLESAQKQLQYLRTPTVQWYLATHTPNMTSQFVTH
jgi:tetratricopeptide (TPR) repeat protein